MGVLGRAGALGVLSALDAAPSLLLDAVGVNAWAAYSVGRRLRAGYTGPLVRLRRSSDNVESDFGCASGSDWLDEAAVLSWVGSNSAFIVRGYDQSGGGRDLSQTTAANQLLLVNAGTVERLSATGTAATRPAAFFTSLNNLQRYLSWSASPLCMAAVQRVAATSTGSNALAGVAFSWMARRHFGGSNWQTGDAYFKGKGEGTTTAPQIVLQTPGFNDGVPHQHFLRAAAGGTEWRTDGTARAARAGTTLAGDLPASTNTLIWGNYSNEGSSGHQAELVMWAADLSASQSDAAIANQRQAWGT